MFYRYRILGDDDTQPCIKWLARLGKMAFSHNFSVLWISKWVLSSSYHYHVIRRNIFYLLTVYGLISDWAEFQHFYYSSISIALNQLLFSNNGSKNYLWANQDMYEWVRCLMDLKNYSMSNYLVRETILLMNILVTNY